MQHEHTALLQTQPKDDKQQKRVATLQKLKAVLLKMKKEGKKLDPKVRQHLLQKLHSMQQERAALLQTQPKDDKQGKRVAALQKLKAALLKMKKEGKKLDPKVRQLLLQKLHSMQHKRTALLQTQPKDDKQQNRVAALQKLKAVLLKMKKEGKKLDPKVRQQLVEKLHSMHHERTALLQTQH